MKKDKTNVPAQTSATKSEGLSERDWTEAMEATKRMVFHMKRRLPSWIDADDMIQDGMVGLVRSSRRFDPHRGTKLGTFANLLINASICDGLRGNDVLSSSERQAVKQGLSPAGARRLVPLDEARDISDQEVVDSETLLERVRIQAVGREALAQLPPRLQQLYSLLFVEEQSAEVVGRVLGVRSSQLYRLRNQLISRVSSVLRKHTTTNSDTGDQLSPEEKAHMASAGKNQKKSPNAKNAAFRKRWIIFLALVLNQTVPEVLNRGHLLRLEHADFPVSEVDNFLQAALNKGKLTLVDQHSPRQYQVNIDPVERLREEFQHFYRRDGRVMVLNKIAQVEDPSDRTFTTVDLQITLLELTNIEPSETEITILIDRYLQDGVFEKVVEDKYQITEGFRAPVATSSETSDEDEEGVSGDDEEEEVSEEERDEYNGPQNSDTMLR